MDKKTAKKEAWPEAIVGALIVNNKENILLAKSKKFIGQYTIFGGHVEFGEKMEDAVKREVKEEAGIDIVVESKLSFNENIFDKGFFKKDKHFIFIDFVCRYDGGDDDIKTNGEYEDDFVWVNPEEALKLKMPNGSHWAVEEYVRYLELKKAEEYLEGWKRTQADFDNYRRMQTESQKDLLKYATQNIILQLIPVLDNFHMSTDHIPEDQKSGGWVVGIMHIQKQLEQVLTDNGVEEIQAEPGDAFDPVLHEAIEDKECADCDVEHKYKNKLKKILTKGYRIGDKVIRPARVVVE